MKKSPDLAAMEDLMAEEPAEDAEMDVEAEPKAKGDPEQLLASIEAKLAQLRGML
jgi:hypothetical protein